MGRKQQTQPPVPATYIREAFHVRQDGRIVRRSTGEIATFRGAQLLVRVYHQGHIRRFAAGRIAWAIAVGEWPKGVVKARNGVDDDLRESNLILTKAGPRPFDQGKGGMASWLERRSRTTTALINALAENPDATVPQLSRLVGRSESCCCVRLAKLEAQGLTCSPKCQAHIRWQLSQTGKALAASALPLIDGFEKQILTALARSPLRQLQLARLVNCCSLTAKRRLSSIVVRGLVSRTDGRFMVTAAGLAALGPDAPRPWVRPEAVAASLAKDVTARPSLDVMTRVEMGRMGGMVAARLRKASLMDERMAS
jgi:hypothetical protein